MGRTMFFFSLILSFKVTLHCCVVRLMPTHEKLAGEVQKIVIGTAHKAA
jgi:hypothetical protein